MQEQIVISDQLDAQGNQPGFAASLSPMAFAAASAIKHGAIALSIIAMSDAFDVKHLALEIELLEEGAEIYDLANVIEAEAEAILAGVEPTRCLDKIAEQLKKLSEICNTDQVDWGAEVSVRFIGKAIERETLALGAIVPGCS